MATLIAYRLSEKKSIIQSAILTIELLLLSTGLISTFFMLKKAINPRYLFDMFLFNLKEVFTCLKSFLSSPLYICLFINSVVILILTFSKFHRSTMDFLNIFLDEKNVGAENMQIQDHESESPQLCSPPQHHEKDDKPNRSNSAIAMDTVMSFFSRYNNSHPVLEDIEDEMPCSVKDIEIDCVQKMSFPDISHLTQAREIISPLSTNPVPQPTIKTNYTTTYTNQQEMTNQENIEELEEVNDSLEATWNAITGGGNKKNKKQVVLKKSETWTAEPEARVVSSAQSIGSKDLLPSVASAWKDLRKALTFNDALSVFRRGGLRGDFNSVSAEESNKRFDDFIKKINRERMLQRQESDQRAFNNMLNRAR
ncbi:uncharacterized protein [Nicotiana sylvestris]|uniref:DUF4408 domain-containing protein n=2 Tax=Nicotiana TaxID=4085 RepID=A0A1S4B3Q2_TOBAC|nr:PREDICTED: uncharacterized protein LOC104241924 [Nicotiana sylvestris]XP_016483552.1 PREDICTED: uncharacterized protein LOC107804214 [Nicotiana tabacum]